MEVGRVEFEKEELSQKLFILLRPPEKVVNIVVDFCAMKAFEKLFFVLMWTRSFK